VGGRVNLGWGVRDVEDGKTFTEGKERKSNRQSSGEKREARGGESGMLAKKKNRGSKPKFAKNRRNEEADRVGAHR